MYKDVLRAIAGIDTFPVVSLLLFVITFVLVLLWVLRMDRASVERMAALPLDSPAGADTDPAAALTEGDSRGA